MSSLLFCFSPLPAPGTCLFSTPFMHSHSSISSLIPPSPHVNGNTELMGKMGELISLFLMLLCFLSLNARLTHLHILIENRIVERVRAPGSPFCRCLPVMSRGFCLVQNKRSSFGRSLEITTKPCTAPPTSLCMCPTKTGQHRSSQRPL